ncbi:glycosyltransferase [Moheibacter sediminis]|uniref:Glycosyltransferase involved in cell wall bisynthesis n=1 Tax=Moheibacter sediminis TaxID=1434700 RepID=A0A1W2BB34_9FLAO|nr:glycosyltransferase [Moheibacter sediminis]SMC69922.1 Glycosyltransferase involved in cell wall bisynthesis [Moheibacter sediminis]
MKNKNSNICFFVTTLDSGGLENYLLRFLQYKAENFGKIIVFCKGGKSGQLEEKYKSISDLTIHIKEISYFNPKDYIYLYKFLKKNRISSVCDFTGNFAGLILFTAKCANISKRVSFYRGSSNHFIESGLRLMYNKFVKYLTYKYATDILSNSKAAFDFFYPDIWKKDNRFEVIYNGINPATFVNENKNLRQELNIPENAFVIGHTGRYNEAKNHKTILKVALEFCKRNKDFYFLFCGNGVKDNLEEIIKKHQFQQRIIVLNNRTDIPKVLKTIDCYYFPSITEGQPNALIEAMIMNIPIVASDIPSIKESVPDYFVEELVPAESVDEAIDKILQVYTTDNYPLLGKWAIEKFDYKLLFEQFFAVLNNKKIK